MLARVRLCRTPLRLRAPSTAVLQLPRALRSAMGRRAATGAVSMSGADGPSLRVVAVRIFGLVARQRSYFCIPQAFGRKCR